MIFLGQPWKDVAKRIGVLRTIIGRNLHAHNHNLGAVGLQAAYDGRKVLAGGFGRKPSQSVIGAELHNYNGRVERGDGLDAIETLGRDFTAHPGVDDSVAIPCCIHFRLKFGRIIQAWINSLSGSKTIPESNNDRPQVLFRQNGGSRRSIILCRLGPAAAETNQNQENDKRSLSDQFRLL